MKKKIRRINQLVFCARSVATFPKFSQIKCAVSLELIELCGRSQETCDMRNTPSGVRVCFRFRNHIIPLRTLFERKHTSICLTGGPCAPGEIGTHSVHSPNVVQRAIISILASDGCEYIWIMLVSALCVPQKGNGVQCCGSKNLKKKSVGRSMQVWGCWLEHRSMFTKAKSSTYWVSDSFCHHKRYRI